MGSFRASADDQVLMVTTASDTGLEVVDLRTDAAFAKRRLHTRDLSLQMDRTRGRPPLPELVRQLLALPLAPLENAKQL